MDPPRPPAHHLELFADPSNAKDIIKGILHTIFFHRTFPAIRPLTRDILDTTLPAVDDVDLESLIHAQATDLLRQIDDNSPPSTAGGAPSNGRGALTVQFFEKRRRKTYTFFGRPQDEEVCWEQWTLDVTLARPKTDNEAEKVRAAMEKGLQKAAMKVVGIAGAEKDHIPPITTSGENPFPYQIALGGPKAYSRVGQGIGIF